MSAVLDAALQLQRFCEARNWRFCIIGGLAVLRWGEPRLTQDVDVTLLTGLGQEAVYVDELLGCYRARIAQDRQFALQYRVLLLQADNGIPLDIALGAMPFEERSIERATLYEFAPGYLLLTCSAEDLIVHKAFADRPQDWIDIETILIRQRSRLQVQIIWDELTPLAELKEEPDIVRRLAQMMEAVSGA